MALALGEGGEQTAPLGRAVIGGLAASTLTTLLVLPGLFALFQGKVGRQSASLDPDDPHSPHYVRVPAAAQASRARGEVAEAPAPWPAEIADGNTGHRQPGQA